ncbi:CPBP family intramembrane glutamic endopeptidase [Aquibacillus saliphilus]|uniref:CPBP family intramembrane glutamic endopeptidase n=1 Tax=Aquibacillus saliphilus TaxID=1909422 RepID=UPI001CF046D6|nr:type II CAAX endopeptidase family protein [Aquibacillus saliphilus]
MSELLSLRKISVWSVIGKIVLLMVLSFLALLFLDFTSNIDLNRINDLYSVIIYVGTIFILFRSFKVKGIKREHIIGNVSIRHKGWIKYISTLLFIMVFSVFSFLALLYLITGMYEELIQEVLSTTNEPQNPVGIPILLSTFIITVILAPFAEELLFRGFLFNRWGVTIGLGKAMMISSIVFSLIHFNGGFIGQFIFSIFVCIIYVKTKKLIIPIILHGLNNLIAMIPEILDFILYSQTESIKEPDPGELEQLLNYLRLALGISTIFFIILIPIMIYILYRLYPKGVKVTPYEVNKLKSA